MGLIILQNSRIFLWTSAVFERKLWGECQKDEWDWEGLTDQATLWTMTVYNLTNLGIRTIWWRIEIEPAVAVVSELLSNWLHHEDVTPFGVYSYARPILRWDN